MLGFKTLGTLINVVRRRKLLLDVSLLAQPLLIQTTDQHPLLSNHLFKIMGNPIFFSLTKAKWREHFFDVQLQIIWTSRTFVGFFGLLFKLENLASLNTAFFLFS